MQKTLTHNLIKNYILNSNYLFQPYYPNRYKYGFSDTYQIKNNTYTCHRHKYILNFTTTKTPLKLFLNKLQTQFKNYNFKYKLEDLINYQTGEIIALKLTTLYYTKN